MKIYVDNHGVEISVANENWLVIVSELPYFYKEVVITDEEQDLDDVVEGVDINHWRVKICRLKKREFKNVVKKVKELAEIDNEIDQEAEVHNFLFRKVYSILYEHGYG
ncbi:MAG: hypothetical protein NC926_10310 [Candidatus Omnitrophica bacterium]|nr:hypothetical protein [Candidatus Omnitrophota bacterium]